MSDELPIILFARDTYFDEHKWIELIERRRAKVAAELGDQAHEIVPFTHAERAMLQASLLATIETMKAGMDLVLVELRQMLEQAHRQLDERIANVRRGLAESRSYSSEAFRHYDSRLEQLRIEMQKDYDYLRDLLDQTHRAIGAEVRQS